MEVKTTKKEEKLEIIPDDNQSLKEDIISSRKLNLRKLVELKESQIEGFRIRHAFCEGRIYFVLKDTYVKLGVKDPAASGRMFQYNHKDKFLPESFRKFEFKTTLGKRTYLTATFDVISFICSRANSDIAFDYLKAVGKLHQKLFEGELSIMPSQEAINLFVEEQQFKTHLLEKRLDQVTSVLNQQNTKLEQVYNTISELHEQQNKEKEESAVPENGTITYRRKIIRSLIKDSAQREGVHFNSLANKLKKELNLYSYKIIPKEVYKKAVSWLNARQDKAEQEKKLVSLLNFIEQPKEDMEGNN
ncbi:MAG: hypothetical protein HGN29_09265 [Asgard group archaeon]|nr:hypothetical protein [Asgard group archaeon]